MMSNSAALIREQYQFIMVDEFQDTNGLQSSIVDLIMEGQDQPNILVVGDDEQSDPSFSRSCHGKYH